MGRRLAVRITRIAAQLGTLRVDWIQPLDAAGPYRAFLSVTAKACIISASPCWIALAFDNELAAFAAAGVGVTARGDRR